MLQLSVRFFPFSELTPLQVSEQRCKAIDVQLSEKEAHIKELKSQAANASTQVTELSKLTHRLELELTAAHTKLEVQQAMSLELRAYMKRQEIVEASLKETKA